MSSIVSYSINLAAGSQMDLSAGINAKLLPLLNQAVRAVADQAAKNWMEAVYRAKLWSGEKDAYAQSIKWEMTGDFSARVSSDYQHAAEIETGRPARDLKRMLDTSPKVRRTEAGKRFLVIPMRSNTPGNSAHAKPMPPQVYAMAKAMTPSRVLAVGQRPSGEVTHLSPKTGLHASAKQSPFLSNPKTKKAAMVASAKYAWGSKLTTGMLKAAGMQAQDVKRYAGMVRMETSTPGGGKSSSYLGFRIMMDSQSGKWIIPAQPGMFLVKKVADDLAPKAEQAFAAAVAKTISG